MINESQKCQYCKGPSSDSYTCEVCDKGWPRESCSCENNGDYCVACESWIEYRRMSVQLGRKPKASENPFINEIYRDQLRYEEDLKS